jgi:hypothetical protein
VRAFCAIPGPPLIQTSRIGAPFLLLQLGIEKWHLDIPRAMSATFGLKSISAEKSAIEMGRPENERSFAKGSHEISCLSDVEIVGLPSKTGFGLTRIK